MLKFGILLSFLRGSVKRNDDMGLLVGNLKAAGIDPRDIDYLIPSHAHIDHIGGILAADGTHNFPNAQIFISQEDLEYWTNEGLAGTPAEGCILWLPRRHGRRYSA